MVQVPEPTGIATDPAILLSEREDGLQAWGFLLAGGVIQSVSFDCF